MECTLPDPCRGEQHEFRAVRGGANTRKAPDLDTAHGVSACRDELKIWGECLLKEIREGFVKQKAELLAALSGAQGLPSTCSAVSGSGATDLANGFSEVQSRAPEARLEPCSMQPLVLADKPGHSTEHVCGAINSLFNGKSLANEEIKCYLIEETGLARMSHGGTEQLEDEEDREEVKLRVDGAFAAIFTKDDTDLEQPHVTVEFYYKNSGCAQSLARSERFMNLTLSVIACNAVYIGYEQDWNDATTLYEADWQFIIFDNAFCFFFVFELLVRFLAFRNKIDCTRDGWFRFDFVLVCLMVFETWILATILHVSKSHSLGIPVQPARLMRLLRLTRMARLMRALPEIVTMTKGMMMASRAVLSALFMSAALTYCFAIILQMVLHDEVALNEKMKEEIDRSFATIPNTMWTLLLDGTFMMDGAGIILTEMVRQSSVSTIVGCMLFLTFMLLSALTVMNMLIGVLCKVVCAVSDGEVDDSAIRLMKETILLDIKKFDDGDGMITHDELMRVMMDPQSKNVLKSLNIDRLFLMELQRMLFPKHDSKVPVKAVMELMLMCRGDLPTTVNALSRGLSYVSTVVHHFEHRLTGHLDVIRRLTEANLRLCKSESALVQLTQPAVSEWPAAAP